MVVRAGFLLFGLLGAALSGHAQARGAFRADRMDTVLYGVRITRNTCHMNG